MVCSQPADGILLYRYASQPLHRECRDCAFKTLEAWLTILAKTIVQDYRFLLLPSLQNQCNAEDDWRGRNLHACE